jgi:hypothetical protein
VATLVECGGGFISASTQFQRKRLLLQERL